MTNVVYVTPALFAAYKAAIQATRREVYCPRARDGAEAKAAYKAKLDAVRRRVLGDQWQPGCTVHPMRAKTA
jgi:hypothetical protein